jgi:hypothetical protein
MQVDITPLRIMQFKVARRDNTHITVVVAEDPDLLK